MNLNMHKKLAYDSGKALATLIEKWRSVPLHYALGTKIQLTASMSAGLILDFSSSSSAMQLVCSVVVVTIVVVTTWCDSDWLVSAISQLVCNEIHKGR